MKRLLAYQQLSFLVEIIDLPVFIYASFSVPIAYMCKTAEGQSGCVAMARRKFHQPSQLRAWTYV